METKLSYRHRYQYLYTTQSETLNLKFLLVSEQMLQARGHSFDVSLPPGHFRVGPWLENGID